MLRNLTFKHLFELQKLAAPPSTRKSTPVTKPVASLARNRTASATSSGAPIRFIGVLAIICSRNAGIASGGKPPVRWMMGVSIGPGLTTFTLMPLPTNSAAKDRPRARNPALLAEYTDPVGMPFTAPIEPVSTIEAPFDMSGRAFCTVKKTPFRLVSWIRSQSASVTASMGTKAPIPAFTNRTSTRP
jgi:hypothetical protein